MANTNNNAAQAAADKAESGAKETQTADATVSDKVVPSFHGATFAERAKLRAAEADRAKAEAK